MIESLKLLNKPFLILYINKKEDLENLIKENDSFFQKYKGLEHKYFVLNYETPSYDFHKEGNKITGEFKI